MSLPCSIGLHNHSFDLDFNGRLFEYCDRRGKEFGERVELSDGICVRKDRTMLTMWDEALKLRVDYCKCSHKDVCFILYGNGRYKTFCNECKHMLSNQSLMYHPDDLSQCSEVGRTLDEELEGRRLLKIRDGVYVTRKGE